MHDPDSGVHFRDVHSTDFRATLQRMGKQKWVNMGCDALQPVNNTAVQVFVVFLDLYVVTFGSGIMLVLAAGTLA